MAESAGTTSLIQNWLDLANAGDESAWDQLIHHSCERLRQLTHRMLRSYPRLRRWEETEDVLQNALLRLHRSLSEVRPESVKQFFGLAATQIRRTLLDLCRHHFGPEGLGANYETDYLDAVSDNRKSPAHQVAPDKGDTPTTIAQWAEFHEKIEELSSEEQEVFNLLWYEGLTQSEAANVLKISLRTLARRWQAARLSLYESMHGDMPE